MLSPSTAGKGRIKELPIHAAHGVAHAWLVDPLARSLDVSRLEGEHWLLAGAHEGAIEVRAEPFDAVGVDLSELWLAAP